MAAKDTTLTRRSSRKKLQDTKDAHRKRLSTSTPRLGAYGRKHPAIKLTPGHKTILRQQVPGKSPKSSAGSKNFHLNASTHEFLIFCIKHVLTSGNLVSRDGPYWHLREDVAGVSFGENFVSLDACAQAIISASEMRYQGEALAAA